MDKNPRIIKKDNAYTCIATNKLLLLDVTSYLSMGTSYSAFLKAFDVDEKKGYFPYSHLKSFDVLEETKLPPYESFYSSLKKHQYFRRRIHIMAKQWNER